MLATPPSIDKSNRYAPMVLNPDRWLKSTVHLFEAYHIF